MSLLNHFRPEEHKFVERVLEWVEHVQTRYRSRLTSFLDPREQFIVQSITGREPDVLVAFNGGYEQAERKRAYIYPKLWEGTELNFELSLYTVKTNQKIIPFEHRDVLGALLGLGIKREKFGDILLTDNHLQIIMSADIAEYVELHFKQINRYKIDCEPTDWQDLLVPEENWHYFQTTTSSLRLDAILSELLRMSRTKVLPLIKAGRVKVNWKLIDDPSFLLEEGDHVSVRGYGRFLFAKVEGETKKKKQRITLGRKE